MSKEIRPRHVPTQISKGPESTKLSLTLTPTSIASACLLLILSAIGLSAVVALALEGPDEDLMKIIALGAALGVTFIVVGVFSFFALRRASLAEKEGREDDSV